MTRMRPNPAPMRPYTTYPGQPVPVDLTAPILKAPPSVTASAAQPDPP